MGSSRGQKKSGHLAKCVFKRTGCDCCFRWFTLKWKGENAKSTFNPQTAVLDVALSVSAFNEHL